MGVDKRVWGGGRGGYVGGINKSDQKLGPCWDSQVFKLEDQMKGNSGLGALSKLDGGANPHPAIQRSPSAKGFSKV